MRILFFFCQGDFLCCVPSPRAFPAPPFQVRSSKGDDFGLFRSHPLSSVDLPPGSLTTQDFSPSTSPDFSFFLFFFQFFIRIRTLSLGSGFRPVCLSSVHFVGSRHRRDFSVFFSSGLLAQSSSSLQSSPDWKFLAGTPSPPQLFTVLLLQVFLPEDLLVPCLFVFRLGPPDPFLRSPPILSLL